MAARARLVATVPRLLPSQEADAPVIIGMPGNRMLSQRSDDALVVCLLDDDYGVRPGTEIRFNAPWPARRDSWVLAPDASLAVFVGVHAIHAIDASGAVRWQLRHGCWQGTCTDLHHSYDEYADRPDHRYPKRGSAGFSVDGKLVWAHVQGPLAQDEPGQQRDEQWLVLDVNNGRVLARAETDTAAEGSIHVPHPTDARQMGVSIGEGQDGAPVRWGRWNGEELRVDYIDDDVVLLDVSPSGKWLMTVSHDQDILAIRGTYGGPELAAVELRSDLVLPRHPETEPENDEPALYWDWIGGFVDETTVIASTDECDSDWGTGRHWLIDTQGVHPPTLINYPVAVSVPPTPLGDGTWFTPSGAGDTLQVWAVAMI